MLAQRLAPPPSLSSALQPSYAPNLLPYPGPKTSSALSLWTPLSNLYPAMPPLCYVPYTSPMTSSAPSLASAFLLSNPATPLICYPTLALRLAPPPLWPLLRSIQPSYAPHFSVALLLIIAVTNSSITIMTVC